MITTVLLWGLAAGLVHFVVIGILYGNPLTERIPAEAEAETGCGYRRQTLHSKGSINQDVPFLAKPGE